MTNADENVLAYTLSTCPSQAPVCWPIRSIPVAHYSMFGQQVIVLCFKRIKVKVGSLVLSFRNADARRKVQDVAEDCKLHWLLIIELGIRVAYACRYTGPNEFQVTQSC